MNEERWLRYFKTNRDRPETPVPARLGDGLPKGLRGPLVRALQHLELGETGEGRIVAQAARERALGPGGREALKLYIAEEGRHARQLRAALRALGASPLERHATEVLYRRARRAVGFRTKMLVVAAAEVVGVALYGALRDGVPCPVMSALCAEIALDEAAHLDFQADYFEALVALAPPPLRPAYGALLAAAFALVLAGAVATLLVDQRALLRAMGVGPGGFAAGCVREALARRGRLQGGPEGPTGRHRLAASRSRTSRS